MTTPNNVVKQFSFLAITFMLSHIFNNPTQSTCSHNAFVYHFNILLNLPRFCYYGRFFSQSNTRQVDTLPRSSICHSKTEPTYVKHTKFSTYYEKHHFDGRYVSHVAIVKSIQIILSRTS